MAGSGRFDAEGSLGAVLGVGSPLGLGDGALVERFVARPGSAGGEAAFEALVARHGAMVRRVCRQALRSEADADDAYQAVFLVLARRAGAIRDPDLLAPWLYGVALRTARLARRRRRVVAGLGDEPVADRPDGCPVEGAEAAEALHAEVARLPEAQRRAVVLCHWQGLTHDEAARRLGVPTGTISVRLMRARDRLRDRLTRRGFAPGAPLFPALDRVEAIPPRAWAALSHLRGNAAGEVPAGVASLASGALAMKFGPTKIAALALLATGLAATGAWSLAQGPARPMPAQAPAAPKEGSPAPIPPLSRRTDEPTPRQPIPVKNPHISEFYQIYRLEPGQIIRRIPPPFAAWRADAAEANIRGGRGLEDRRERDKIVTLTYHQDQLGNLVDPTWTVGGEPSSGIWLSDLLRVIGGFRFPNVEGPSDLLQTKIPGDWVVSLAAAPDQRIAALDAILTNECKLPIRLQLANWEREVVVARGRFEARPVIDKQEAIQIYGATLTPEDLGGGAGDSVAFLANLGRFIAPRRTLVDEIEVPPGSSFIWKENARTPATEQTTREDRDEAAVLRHVAEQTGLTFTTERRRVPVITVERAE